MGLEICSGGKLSLEILFNCEVWNRGWGVVHSLTKRKLQCMSMEIIAKDRLCFQDGGW